MTRMPERLFASFNEDLTRLKIVRMIDSGWNTSQTIQLLPYVSDRKKKRVFITKSLDSSPMLKHIPLDTGEQIYLWRTPWCMYNKETGTWIHILDSDKMYAIPGEFIYKEKYIDSLVEASRVVEKQALSTQMIASISESESVHLGTAPSILQIAPSAPPALPSPPSFVAQIIKRDAIQRRESCPISLETFTNHMKARITPCFHIFQEDSLNQWLTKEVSCPMCKAYISCEQCVSV